MKEQEKYTAGQLLKSLLPYYKKYRWIVVLDLCCTGLTTVCELV